LLVDCVGSVDDVRLQIQIQVRSYSTKDHRQTDGSAETNVRYRSEAIGQKKLGRVVCSQSACTETVATDSSSLADTDHTRRAVESQRRIADIYSSTGHQEMHFCTFTSAHSYAVHWRFLPIPASVM